MRPPLAASPAIATAPIRKGSGEPEVCLLTAGAASTIFGLDVDRLADFDTGAAEGGLVVSEAEPFEPPDPPGLVVLVVAAAGLAFDGG